MRLDHRLASGFLAPHPGWNEQAAKGKRGEKTAKSNSIHGGVSIL
jgi:hypothetical protein